MSSIEFRTLKEKDFPEWCIFIDKAYGKNYVLTDKIFLHWFLKKNRKYETIIAVDGKTIVGTYGALQVPLRVNDSVYDLCWWVSGIVLPEYRNQGIGKNFIKISLDKFDVCGGLGFNQNVRRNYVRFGLKQFGFKTLRRFALFINIDSYLLIREKFREEMKRLLLISKDSRKIDYPIENLKSFTNSVIRCFDGMKHHVKVNTHRTPEYLNWRYIKNPKIQYECSAVLDDRKYKAYVVSRHERFYPTKLFATRIIDLIGEPEYASDLIAHEINKALQRNDAFLDFSFTGNFYEKILEHHGFSEILGDHYGALPLVSTPMEYRENEEFICLGSKRFPSLFDDIEFNDLYFTRGDSDRDRYNKLPNT
jgi:hypothetical protein